jgi:hypothetical protein
MVGDMGIGTWGQPAHRPEDPHELLTLEEFFRLFYRGLQQTRWLGSADSEEYLAVVTYLVQRSCKH